VKLARTGADLFPGGMSCTFDAPIWFPDGAERAYVTSLSKSK